MQLGIKNFVGGPAGTLFGDGTYSANIIQGGSVLQPQASHTAYVDTAPTAALSCVSSVYSGYPLSNLVDGNNTTGGSATVSAGIYGMLIFTYTAAVEIRQLSLSCNFGTLNQAVKLMYSDDGTAWFNTDGVTMSVPYGSTVYTFDKAAYGAHRFWALQNTTTGGYIQFTTVELRQAVLLSNVIIITGAATVTPDAVTGASLVMCNAIIVDGANASLSASTNSKGLLIFAKTGIYEVNGGKIHMDGKGKAGNFGDLTVYSLLPAAMQRKLKRSVWNGFVLKGEGAAGGAFKSTGGSTPVAGNPGAVAASMQTGGGGAGGRNSTAAGNTSAGGRGGTCCGGAGGGGIFTSAIDPPMNGGDYGGPGGAASGNGGAYCGGGGAGDPVGTAYGDGTSGYGAGGGLLILASPILTISSGCRVSADGANGGSSGSGGGGGGAGGGAILIVTTVDGYANSGTVQAAGGVQTDGYAGARGGSGGAGSVNILTV